MIQFAHPAALWLLALLIPIVLLYLLKQKRREVEVPSVLLWKQAIQDLRAHTPFQKFRSSLLLLLQILIIVLLTAILSEPYLSRGIQQSQRVLLVLDASASMKARDARPDRFSAAKDELVKILDSLSPSTEVMLITFSSRASVLLPFTRNINSIKNALSSTKPQDVAGRWDELSLLLNPLLKTNPHPRVIIASDFAGMPPDLAERLGFDPRVVGSSGENLGIVRAVLQPMPDNPDKQLLFYQFKNFGSRTSTVDLKISSGDSLIDAFQTTLSAGKQEDRTMELTIVRPSQLRIEIANTDSFPLDNDFVLPSKPAEPIAVNVQIKDPFLVKALQALPNVRQEEHASIQISAKEINGPGIVFLAAMPTASSGEVIQWNASHPVLRFINPRLWHLTHVSTMKVPVQGTVLLETREGPVGYALETVKGRQIVFGFALSDSNLYLRAGFPVFLQNALDWIHAGMKNSQPVYTNTEFPVEGPVANSGYVNFSDPSESNITPQHPASKSHQEKGTLALRHDLSTWFLILLIAAVIVEWWVFHQRIHVEA